ASRLGLGTPAFLVNYNDPQHFNVTFTRQGVKIATYDARRTYERGYDQLVAYRMAPNATLTLLRRLPVGLLPAENEADRYDPLARMCPGPSGRPRYFRRPYWVDPLPDLFGGDDGVVLGPGWGPLQAADGRYGRRAGRDAEVVVNPRGEDRR